MQAISSIQPSTKITGKLTTRDSPIESEKIKLYKQSSETSPVRAINIPLPVGITEPVNENAKTAASLDETVNPYTSASPPYTDSTQPL